jgi:outer membrane murein-binding lipoprotein Lpp
MTLRKLLPYLPYLLALVIGGTGVGWLQSLRQKNERLTHRVELLRRDSTALAANVRAAQVDLTRCKEALTLVKQDVAELGGAGVLPTLETLKRRRR